MTAVLTAGRTAEMSRSEAKEGAITTAQNRGHVEKVEKTKSALEQLECSKYTQGGEKGSAARWRNFEMVFVSFPFPRAEVLRTVATWLGAERRVM